MDTVRRIFITGSSDGLGMAAAELLAEAGHSVVLHARNAQRAEDARRRLPAAEGVVIGDVSSMAAARSVADQVNALGRCDAVIHNVAVGTSEARVMTEDGMTRLFAVNVAAPYVLTALIAKPDRLVYLSSDMHRHGSADLDDPQWEKRRWNASQAYSDSKLHDVTLAMYLARRWPDCFVNSLSPGWVPTKMGGRHAPDSLIDGAATQAWLAASDDEAARITGGYFFHMRRQRCHPAATRADVQERLIGYLEHVTSVTLPSGV